MKTKIVHYILKLKDGGAQTQLVLLCNNIDLDKYDVTIVCNSKQTSIALRDEIEIIEIPRTKKYNLFGFFKHVYDLTITLKPNIVQLWMPEIITLPAALAAKRNNIPIVSTERRIPVTAVGKLWLRDRIKYLIHEMSSIIIANFPLPIKRKSVFNKIIAHKKHQTIYNGLDIDGLASLRINNKPPANGPFKLVYSGRFVDEKNVDLLLKAVKTLKDQGFKIELVLYGTGKDEKILKQLSANLQLDDVVKFMGYQSDWKEKSVDADCFILPSNREGMPNVLFEAIAIGLPIISTNIEEIACHFTNNYDALLVTPKNTDELTNAIKQAIENPELLNKIKNNGLITVQKYTIKNMVSRYEEIYQELT